MAEIKTVAMVRDSEQYPAPHVADVHPDEVENYAAGGWMAAQPKAKRAAEQPPE